MKPLFTIFSVFITSSTAFAAGLSDLDINIDWHPVARGVWRAQLGDVSQEMRYTDLSAGPPKVASINRVGTDTVFPFKKGDIGFRRSADHKIMVRLPTQPNEQVFGYGLQFDDARKNRRILDLKVDHFNRGGGATHAPVPFYLSSRGYGVFFNTAKYIKVYNNVGNRKDSPHNPAPVDRNPPPDEKQPGPWLAQPPGDAVEASLHGQGLELIIFSGTTLKDVVAKYNLFCGGGVLPPLWGLGFWHRVPSKFSAQETLDEIAKFQEYNIPLDVIGLEPGWQTKSYPCTFEWQTKRFPQPREFTQQLLARGIRLNLWENPYISPEAQIYKQMYPLAGSHMVWLGIVPDYTLPEARKILARQHQTQHIDLGISGYKIDEVDGYDFWLWPDHATFPSGTSAEVMRQTYGMQMQHLLQHELFRKANQRTYGLVRASNGAASGYPFVIYSDSYGHKQYINGISAASLSGILWCPEIRSANSDREWLNRMHTVCFSPMAMLNAWASGQKPWSFEKMTGSVRETIQLRMRMLPYLYSEFAKYEQTGVPPIRSMLLECNDLSSLKEDNSLFMFGSDILVAPFFEQSATKRSITLPPGKWFDFYSGDLVGADGDVIERTSEEMQNRVPLFVRNGAIIPMLSKAVNNTEDAYQHALEVRHYGQADGEFDLYEDDGKTFNYERGEFHVRKLTVSQGRLSTTVTHDRGPAMFGAIQSFTKMTR